MNRARQRVHGLVDLECDLQDEKWGEQSHTHEKWLVILTEEIGEIARAVLETDPVSLVAEVIQAAAVCTHWLEDVVEPSTAQELSDRVWIEDRVDELWEELDELEAVLKNWLSFSDARTEFLEIFGDVIPESDEVARREAWNNWTDSLVTDGRITEAQCEAWGNPF